MGKSVKLLLNQRHCGGKLLGSSFPLVNAKTVRFTTLWERYVKGSRIDSGDSEIC